MAYGGFYTRAAAEKFVRLHGGQVVELMSKWGELVGVPDGCDDLDAVWFNEDWEHPVAHWPFWNLALAEAYRRDMGFGIAVEVEYADDDADGGGNELEDPVWLIVWGQQRHSSSRSP
jgi:hypothetical protein